MRGFFDSTGSNRSSRSSLHPNGWLPFLNPLAYTLILYRSFYDPRALAEHTTEETAHEALEVQLDVNRSLVIPHSRLIAVTAYLAIFLPVLWTLLLCQGVVALVNHVWFPTGIDAFELFSFSLVGMLVGSAIGLLFQEAAPPPVATFVGGGFGAGFYFWWHQVPRAFGPAKTQGSTGAMLVYGVLLLWAFASSVQIRRCGVYAVIRGELEAFSARFPKLTLLLLGGMVCMPLLNSLPRSILGFAISIPELKPAAGVSLWYYLHALGILGLVVLRTDDLLFSMPLLVLGRKGLWKRIPLLTGWRVPFLKGALVQAMETELGRGIGRANEILRLECQFHSVARAMRTILARADVEAVFLLASKIAENIADRRILTFLSLRRSKSLPEGAALKLDDEAKGTYRATSAGFHYLSVSALEQAEGAFSDAGAAADPRMVSLVKTLRTYQETAQWTDIATCTSSSSVECIDDTGFRDSWSALQKASALVKDVRHSASRSTKTIAFNRALEVLSVTRKRAERIAPPYREVVRSIVDKWEDILLRASGQLGAISIEAPVSNPYVVGDPVSGRAFVGREDILRRLEELWVLGAQLQSVVLYGHRRMGKTSVLQNVKSSLGAKVRLAYVNLLCLGTSVSGPGEVLAAIADEISREVGVDPPSDSELASSPHYAFKKYLERVIEHSDTLGLVIAFDEFEQLEELIRNGSLPQDFLKYLRALLQMSPRVAFVFAGLHTLEEMTEDYFHPFFASVIPIRVAFLSYDATCQILSNPSSDFLLDYNTEALERVHTVTAGQPYLVQLIGFQLVRLFNRQMFEEHVSRDTLFTREDVEAVVSDTALFAQGQYYFRGVWSQAVAVSVARERTVREIAKHSQGVPTKVVSMLGNLAPDELERSLEVLQRQSIVQEIDGRWSVVVELFRVWLLTQLRPSEIELEHKTIGDANLASNEISGRQLTPVSQHVQERSTEANVLASVQTAWAAVGSERVSRAVLRGLAAICPDTIVADGLADTLGRSLGIDESRSPVEVFMGLADRGLLIRTPGGYIVPRLVAEYVRSQEPWDPLRLESVASTVESHAEAICHFGTLREIRDVVPHVLEMLDVLTSLPQGASRTTGGLCCLAAHYYAEIGEYKTAGDFAERGCRADASLKGDSQLAARNLEALGAVQHASGNIQDSLATLHRARAVASGDTDPRTALCLELRLAGVLIETGSPGDALTAVERAEALLDQHPEVGPLLTILLLSTKGTVWTATAKYAGARSCFERALDLASMGAHRHHSIYGQTLRSYARLLTILNSFSEAKSAGERALWNDLDTLGQRHPAVGFDYLTLAQVYQEYQRFTDAKTMYEKGIGLLGLTFSDDNIWIAQAKYECQLGNPMEPSLRRQSAACNVLPALAEHFGPRSEVVALVYARLGAELFVAGDWEHGAKLDERAQEILFELYGPTHPRSVSAELNRVLMSGRPAEQRFREFLDAFRAQYGADHRLIAVAHLDLAYILIEKGKSVRDACAHLEAGLTTLNRIYGRMTPLSISFLDGLAVGYLLLGEFENSRQLWHETDRLHTLLETDDDDGTKKLKRRPTPIGTFGLYFWWLAMRVRIYANRITRMYQ